MLSKRQYQEGEYDTFFFLLLMQIFIGNNKIKLQFVVLHLNNKVTNNSRSADTYKGSFALF